MSITPTQRGFTLVEIILAIMLFAIISVLSIPVFAQLQSKNDERVAVSTIVSALHRAQVLSQLLYHDSLWGVYFSTSSLTVFGGTDYAHRNPQWDEDTAWPSEVGVSNVSEVVFAKLTGLPVQESTFIVSTTYGDAATITINKLGTVSY